MVTQSKLNSRHQSTFCIVVLNPPFRRYGLPKAICHLFLWAGKVVAGMATFFLPFRPHSSQNFGAGKSGAGLTGIHKSLMTDLIFQYLPLRLRCYSKRNFVDHVEKTWRGTRTFEDEKTYKSR
jgi:hypothetical protein